jgi:transcriptional regulator with XRE-family HTH domain
MTTSSDVTTRPAGTPGTGASPASRLEPGVCRELLARALVQARRDRGLTQERAAAVLGWSLAKLNRIENGTAAIKASDLHAALSLYQVTDLAQAGRLTWLARAGKARPWYGQHPAITPGLGAYLQAERSAAAISGYRVRTVPGLLQTPDYTQAVLAARRVSQPAERAALIAARQELLSYPLCPDITYVIDEAALRRPAGSPAVMAAQLGHLRNAAARTHITIRVAPLTAGVVPPAETLTAITYPDGTTTAWRSTAGGGYTRHDPALALDQMTCLLARSVPADAL